MGNFTSATYELHLTQRRGIRLMIVDDHDLVRQGLRRCIETQPHLTVVCEARDGEEALRSAQSTPADVVLMDVALPGALSGIDTARQLVASRPLVGILGLSGFDTLATVREMIRAGARGYVVKTASPEELFKAIEAVSTGGRWFSPELVEAMTADQAAKEADPEAFRRKQLTEREREVLRLLAQGHNNAETAKQLDIRVRTVETHRENLMRKLGVHSLADLTRHAIAIGLLRIG